MAFMMPGQSARYALKVILASPGSIKQSDAVFASCDVMFASYDVTH